MEMPPTHRFICLNTGPPIWEGLGGVSLGTGFEAPLAAPVVIPHLIVMD